MSSSSNQTKKRPFPTHSNTTNNKRNIITKYHHQEQEEIKRLQTRIQNETPPSGQTLHLTTTTIITPTTLTPSQSPTYPPFTSLPLSHLAIKGLNKHSYTIMTDIQMKAIPHALAGRDVLGAAKTGSGKSLAFIIPLLEDLFRIRWSKEDGLGGMILSPTRELASQIFTVLTNVGEFYGYRYGLLLGGTSYEQEKQDAIRAQVIVGTPGRVLQHLEQTPGFDATFVRVFVLDEADRLLDLGFSEQLEAILSYLPLPRSGTTGSSSNSNSGSGGGGVRQTLMFSATQTKRVRDLATLSLQDPEFISAHAESETSTPINLKQSYIVVELPSKFDTLYSFLRGHTQNKIICFFSSCKQVKFAEAALRKLDIGMSLLALHGKQKANKRRNVYERFCKWEHVVLLATDIAARGLDFPAVDWVIQMDCPDDVATYIHRVGRTARYTSKGNSLIFLLPTEKDSLVKHLQSSKVPIVEESIKSALLNREFHLMTKLRALLAQDVQLKLLAQGAFKGYLRSLHLQPDKTIFIPVNQFASNIIPDFAASLGLSNIPKLSFLKQPGGKLGREEVRQQKQESDRIKTEYQVNKWLGDEQQHQEQHHRRMADDSDSISNISNDDDMDDEQPIMTTTSTISTKKNNNSNNNIPSSISKILKRQPQAHKIIKTEKHNDDNSDDDDDGGLIVKKTSSQPLKGFDDEQQLSKKQRRIINSIPHKTIKIVESGNAKNNQSTRIEFNDSDSEDEKVNPQSNSKKNSSHTLVDDDDSSNNFVAQIAQRLRNEDTKDKKIQREKLHEKHWNEKRKKRMKNDNETTIATLDGNENSTTPLLDADEETALQFISSAKQKKKN
jgi:ATP-dependent RNA helicase DDX10/DBP4